MVLSFLHCLHAVCKQPSWQLCMRLFITMGEIRAQLCGGVSGFTKFWKLRLFRQLCKPMLMLNIIILKSQRLKAQRLCHDHFSLKGLFRPMYKTHHNMTICGLSLHHGNTESCKSLEQKFIFQLGTLSPHGMNTSHSTNLFTNSCDHISTNGKAPLHSHNINHNTRQFLYLFWQRANARNVSFPNLWRW